MSAWPCLCTQACVSMCYYSHLRKGTAEGTNLQRFQLTVHGWCYREKWYHAQRGTPPALFFLLSSLTHAVLSMELAFLSLLLLRPLFFPYIKSIFSGISHWSELVLIGSKFWSATSVDGCLARFQSVERNRKWYLWIVCSGISLWTIGMKGIQQCEAHYIF